MSERFENKIQRLKLDNFTCFSKTIFEFSSGINVFIGENGTGKTHILKALYGMSSTISSPEFQQLLQADFVSLTKTAEVIGTQPHYLYETFFSTFSAKTPKDFIKYDETETEIELLVNGAGFGFHIDKKIVAPIISLDNSLSVKPLFIPSKEIISTQRGFIPYYLKQVNDYDRTYFDLAVNLQSTELKNPPIDLLRDFEDALGFSVVLKQDGFFYIKDKFNKETKSTFEAEGIRKLAQVLRLVMNGSLAKDTILFWDEPEVNLNPRYIKVVVQFLQTLAKNGVQIFVATHDYLLAHLLSVDAEYRAETQSPPMKFFAFYKGEDGTEIESADTLGGIQNNAILDEYSAYYDREQELYYKSRKQTA